MVGINLINYIYMERERERETERERERERERKRHYKQGLVFLVLETITMKNMLPFVYQR